MEKLLLKTASIAAVGVISATALGYCQATTSQTAQTTEQITLKGQHLGESWQQFEFSAIPKDDQQKECKKSHSWAGRHRLLGGAVAVLGDAMTATSQNPMGDDYQLPATANNDCAQYLVLDDADLKATGDINCGPGGLCSGFTGLATFKDGLLTRIAFMAPQEWDETLSGSMAKFGGPPMKQSADITGMRIAGWKTPDYIFIIREQADESLGKKVIAYYATFDQAVADGVAHKDGQTKAAATAPVSKVNPLD
jgi:hypothetical protein